VVDAVSDRLPHRDAGTRDPRELLAHLGHHLRELAPGQIEPCLDMRYVDPLRLLVQRGAARAPGGRDHPRHPQQPPLDTIADLA